MTRTISCLIHACIASAMLLAIPAQAAEQTIVVLDGSGSMWGRIDGQPNFSSGQRRVLATRTIRIEEVEVSL